MEALPISTSSNTVIKTDLKIKYKNEKKPPDGIGEVCPKTNS